MKKSFLPALLLCGMALLVSGCNTVAGFGKDLEKVGEKMQDKSKK
ncbi:entericidin A/B family lipoprotein [Rivibacter subsaxonicus]|uniref:Putative small secreted protein n=1 Tax=Rivibacter subsaxonicus TaxID=457575 RepID=A0A4Q7VPQ3_9BURK|nr:entericidin A/B family lipoprotein [Rivibacter subsaxonicus]RZT98118.1 putative small secreted protein [Rivibacter subsaxonicus]